MSINVQRALTAARPLLKSGEYLDFRSRFFHEATLPTFFRDYESPEEVIEYLKIFISPGVLNQAATDSIREGGFPIFITPTTGPNTGKRQHWWFRDNVTDEGLVQWLEFDPALYYTKEVLDLILSSLGGVSQHDTFEGFPAILGEEEEPEEGVTYALPGKLYVDRSTRLAYYFDDVTTDVGFPRYVKIGSFKTDTLVSLPGGKLWLGVYGNGNVTTSDLHPVEVMSGCAQEALAPTIGLTSNSSQREFNDINFPIRVSYSYTVLTAGANPVATIRLEKRRGTGAWSDLIANVLDPAGSNAANRFVDETINPGGVDNTDIEYKLTVSDNKGGSNTVTYKVGGVQSFKPYVASTKSNPSVGSTSRERGDMATTAQSTITRVSPNIALGTYQWEVSVNGGAYSPIAGATGSLTTTPQTVSVTHSAANTADTVAYRVAITDVQGTTYSNGTTITFNYPYWYSVTAEDGSAISDADILALSTTAPNLKELKGNNSRAKSLSNFGGGDNRIIYVGPATAGIPSWTVNGLPNTAFTTVRNNSAFTNSFGATWNIHVVVMNETSGSPFSSVIIS